MKQIDKKELLKLKLEQKERLDSEILELRRDIFRDEVYARIRVGSVCRFGGMTFTIRAIHINLNETISVNNKMKLEFRLDDIEVVEY